MALYDELYRISRRTLLREIGNTDRLIRQLYIRAAKSIAGQIEIFGKISILAISSPIILALLETIYGFL